MLMKPVLAAALLLALPQAAQDDAILERADKVFADAKAAYENAREKNSAEAFVDAGFKLEEARIKYLVLQEIGAADKQKTAAERLRAVNQLSKLIHDGKVAISGKGVEEGSPKPAEPAAANPADPAPKPAVDVSKRAPIPDPAKQKEAEKLLRDLYKDQYAKKAPADRQALARSLLEEARKSKDDPVSLWVIYREAQDVALQIGDVRTAVAAIDESARFFDVDALAMKNTALTSAAKSAKTPEELAFLALALDRLIEDFMAADLYDAADKSAATAVQAARRSNDPKSIARASSRAKEVTEAKTRFGAMKNVLQTLAKNPDDPGANLEMGQFLSFVKGNWDLGLRFLQKGSDAGLKALAERELTIPTAPAEQMPVADAWYDLAEKEKVAHRKGQLMAHARELYEGALPTAVGLVRSKIEKRLETITGSIGAAPAERGTINLFKLIDLKKDQVTGSWFMKGSAITAQNQQGSRLQIPYVVPAEYDLVVTLERVADDFFYLGLVSEKINFAAVMDYNYRAAFELLDGKDCGAQDDSTTYSKPPIPMGKSTVVRAVVRRTSAKILIDGKVVLNWEGGMNKLSQNPGWTIPNAKCPFLGSHKGGLLFTAVTLIPVLEPGKPLR